MSKHLNTILSFCIGFLLCFLLLDKCKPSPPSSDDLPKPSHHETFTSDTVRPKPEVVKVQVLVPGPARTYTITQIDTNMCNLVHVYQDSLKDANQVIYYQDSVRGQLLGKKMSYKLFVPLMVENTHTITDSIPYPVRINRGGLYISGEIGGNTSGLGISAGADFISKKKWGIGYRYDTRQHTHNVAFKWKLL